MERQKRRKAAVVIPRTRKNSKLETEIIVENNEILTEHPHCTIPPWYFDRQIQSGQSEMRPIFSVHTWDGRNVMTFGCPIGEDQ